MLFADIYSMADSVLNCCVEAKLLFAAGDGFRLIRLAIVWIEGFSVFSFADPSLWLLELLRGAAVGTMPEPVGFDIARSSLSICLALAVAARDAPPPPALFTVFSRPGLSFYLWAGAPASLAE